MGGGVKGRNIESKESQSLIFSFYVDARIDQSVTPQRLLVLNYEDYIKIDPILQNPPSDTKVVASNLRFTCIDYYDYLRVFNRVAELLGGEMPSYKDFLSMLGKTIHGNIVTLCDIANLYTKELGIKVVPWENMPLDAAAEKILAQYYQLKSMLFENWIKKSTVWAANLLEPEAYGIEETFFKDFMFNFTTEGNSLIYLRQPN